MKKMGILVSRKLSFILIAILSKSDQHRTFMNSKLNTNNFTKSVVKWSLQVPMVTLLFISLNTEFVGPKIGKTKLNSDTELNLSVPS